jgi:hypothetical protein
MGLAGCPWLLITLVSQASCQFLSHEAHVPNLAVDTTDSDVEVVICVHT